MPKRINQWGEEDDNVGLDDQMDQFANEPELPAQPGRVTTEPVAPPRVLDLPSQPSTAGYDRGALSQAIQQIQFSGDRGDALAGRSMYNPAEFITKNQGGFAKGVTMVSPDKIRLPDGEIVDIGANVGAGGQAGAIWLSEKDAAKQGSAVGGAPPAGAGVGITGSRTGSASSSFSSGSKDPAVYDAIMRLLKRGEKPVTGEDVASQFDPVARQYDRGATRAREQSAERLAQQGLNQGGQGGPLDTEVQSINEHTTEAKGGLMAQLVGQEIAGRRADVANAIQFAQGEERNQLQMQLAQLDNELRRMGLDLQGKQLSQQNQQFYDTMGYNIGRDEYLFNQTAGQDIGAGA